jgi:hypothetical protein
MLFIYDSLIALDRLESEIHACCEPRLAASCLSGCFS